MGEKSEDVKKENGKADGNEPPAVPRKRAKHSVNSETEKNPQKRNRTKLFGTCMAVMELEKPIREGSYEINIEEMENLEGTKTEKDKSAAAFVDRKKMTKLNWETISGGQPWPILESNLPLSPQVRFSMSWSEAICHIRPQSRKVASKKPTEEIKIIYQFYYQNRARVLNETRQTISCVWCEKEFQSILSLLSHLNACHDRFLYSTPEMKAIQSRMKVKDVHIEVYPNPLKTHSYLGNPNLSESLDIARCLFHRGLNGPIKRTNSTGTQVIIWQGRPIHKSAQPDEKGELDRSECSLITQGHRRLYFHTHSNMPVRACELDVDSEDDSQEEFRWIRENMFHQINEFTDVNKDEKLVMQLWNHHLMSRRVLTLNHIYECCKEITQKYPKYILRKNLRRNFLLHLLNLVDHCLLKPSKVPEIMELLDQQGGEQEPDFLGLNEEKQKLLEIIRRSKSNDNQLYQ